MDIEGAEPFALKGAIESIKKFKPKLAISVYHSLTDFFEIPKIIDEFGPGIQNSIWIILPTWKAKLFYMRKLIRLDFPALKKTLFLKFSYAQTYQNCKIFRLLLTCTYPFAFIFLYPFALARKNKFTPILFSTGMPWRGTTDIPGYSEQCC